MALTTRQLMAGAGMALLAAIVVRILAEPRLIPRLASTSVEIAPPRDGDEGVEASYLLREIPLVPCKDETGDCKLPVLVDVDTGARSRGPAVIDGLPRDRLLAGDLVAIGALHRQSELDETEGKAYRFDAGGLRPSDDRVLKVRETRPAPPASKLDRFPRDLIAFACWDDAEILVDSSDVYVAMCHEIWRLPKGGDRPAKRFSKDQPPRSMHIVMNDTEVFWFSDRGVAWAAKNGEARGMFEGCSESLDKAFISNNESVFCCREGREWPACELARYPKHGGEPTKLADLQFVSSVALDGSTLYVGEDQLKSPTRNMAIYAIDVRTGAKRTLASDQLRNELNSPAHINIAHGDVYWVNTSSVTAITSASQKGGRITVRANADGTLVGNLVFSGEDAFFSTRGNDLFRFRHADKNQFFKKPGWTTDNRVASHALAVDMQHVYWIRPLGKNHHTLVRQPRD